MMATYKRQFINELLFITVKHLTGVLLKKKVAAINISTNIYDYNRQRHCTYLKLQNMYVYSFGNDNYNKNL